MKRALVCLIAVLSFVNARPASAQTIDDLKKSLALTQAEVDRLQAALNAKLGPQNVGGFVDALWPGPDGTLVVVGWALECGKQRPLAQLMIDGIITSNIFLAPYTRPDVNAVYGGYCAPLGGLLDDVGATAIIDLSHYGPGQHSVALRLRALNGFEITSNTVTFTK